jgi:hypothetical protein
LASAADNAFAALLTSVQLACSLRGNQLCGLDRRGRGTYTAEGITALAAALKINQSITSIKYAHTLSIQSVSSRCQQCSLTDVLVFVLASLHFASQREQQHDLLPW